MLQAPAAHACLRWSLRGLALLFAAATVLYTMLWMAAERRTPMVELGFNNTPNLVVTGVFPGSPAERAGLVKGDQITAVGSSAVYDESSMYREYRRHKPGNRVRLTVLRPGVSGPVILTGVFRPRMSVPQARGWPEYLVAEVRNLYPIPFLLVGFAVLFLRLEDPHVWLLALMFASLIASPGIPDGFAAVDPSLKPFAKTYQAIFVGLLGADFYAFFAVFPIRSPIERRLPWLKWVGAAIGLTFGVAGIADGFLRTPAPLSSLLGKAASDQAPLAYVFGFMMLGLVSLAANFFGTADVEARRKMRVMFWGTAVGVTPAALRAAAAGFAGARPAWWTDSIVVLLVFVFPLSFAYAVVKHRVLEIPVLLRRSARYVLVQRGFLILLTCASLAITFAFASSFERYLQPMVRVARPAGMAVGSGFGVALLWGGLAIHRRVRAKIDRAFFRSAYDARLILEELAERTRTSTDRVELARLLEQQIEHALHPEFVAVYLRSDEATLALVAPSAAREPVAVPLDGGTLNRSAFAPLEAEYIAPMPRRNGGLAGALVLGPRLSEEPYSREDERLLSSVASQAATALENLTLAEDIAMRMEAENRMAHEMEIAKAVQTRLLPQTAAVLATLECAARCVQARSVGGDYYDFLHIDSRRTALVLADVSGKGVHAALLMANLQAHLRNQTSITPFDPVHALRQVNRMMCESTGGQHYATLFFSVYDDADRRLVYVNCGHNPPVCLHRDGAVERLSATATVVGLFDQWECTAESVQLVPGDVLVIFSDGVTEAMCNDEEFGEDRLIAQLNSSRCLPANEIAEALVSRVLEFSAGAQSDDLTLLIACVRDPA